jgi:CRP-like cAMP-binding protein
LETLTDTLIAEIPVKALDNLRHNNIEINTFGQKAVENELVRNISNDIAHRSFSAKERLLLLRRLYPNLENLIPHHIIASYLGITNVSFSRLRSELVKK